MVVACLALLVALGGTAVAAKKLVSGDKLIKKHSLSGNRLRNNTLTGRQINAGSLGKVPSAQSADSANALGGTPASAFHCPSGTALLGGSCIESTQRPPATWRAASAVCGAAGRHLPSADQLEAAGSNGQMTWSGSELSSNIDTSLKVVGIASTGVIAALDSSDSNPYRCAVNPVP